MALPAGQQSRANAYNSFTGIDIKAVFNSTVAVPLQAFSYAVQREKAPIYTMGYANPRAFSRGKRGIAGTLVFAMFNKHPLVGPVNPSSATQPIFSKDENANKFWADEEEIRPSIMFTGDRPITDISQVGNPTSIGSNDILPDGNSFNDQILTTPWYPDQIPPFDITLTASNEYGAVVSMAVIGVELVNEGYGISIDDLVSEFQYTFIARELVPWIELEANEEGQGATNAN